MLLSGPPGIGKSSSAAICAKEAGYNAVELNASTTRSKKALSSHVKEVISTVCSYRFCLTIRIATAVSYHLRIF